MFNHKFSSLFLSLLFFPLSSFAQDSVSLDSVSLDTVTIQGTKDGKTYFEEPGGVSVLREKELPANGRSNGIQILTATPNVEVNKNGESFSIRGISNAGVTGYQKDSLASIVIDNIFQSDLTLQASSFDLFDLDRIEILRGAQSTTSGVNALAGLILMNHARPDFSHNGFAKIGLGNFWHREVGAVENVTLIDQKLALRVSYDKEQDNGFIDNVSSPNKNWGGWDRDCVRAAADYKISNDQTLTFDAKYNRNAQGGTYTQGSDPFAYQVTEDRDFKQNTQNAQIGATFTKVLNERVRNVTLLGSSLTWQTISSDADGTAQPTAGTRNEDHKDHFVSLENQWHYSGEKLKNLVGLHAHDYNLKDNYDFNLLLKISSTATTPLHVTQSVERPRRTYALFDSATYKFDDKNSVFGGLRGEYVDNGYSTVVAGQRLEDLGSTYNAYVDNMVAQTSGNYGRSRGTFVVLPKLGYAYETGPHHLSAFYTRGYRTAGVSINRQRAKAVEYDPEFTNNYEASYKVAKNGIESAFNVFYVDWRDQQVETKLSSDFYDTQVENAASSHLYGAELETKIPLTTSQSLLASVGYSKTAFDNFTVNNVNYKGKRFPFASEWTARLAHDWKTTRDLSFYSIVRYVGPSFTDTANSRSADAQLYVDLNATYTLGSWILQAYVNNALNGKYLIFDGRPSSTASAYQANYYQTSTPTEYGLRASYYW